MVRLSALAAVAALALTGCAADPAPEGEAAGETIRVGYAGPTLNNAFFVGLQQGVRQGAEAQGFELVETNANGDAQQQFNDAVNLLSQDIDALILTPIDSQAIAPAVIQANEAGIPVFTLDRGSEGGDITSFVASDNIAAGTTAAEWIADLLTERYGEPRGNVVNLVGLIGTTAAADRDEGFKTALAEYPDITIVAEQEGAFDQERSLNAMTNILQVEAQIDAVFGANDDNTIGAVRAIEGAGRYLPPSDPGHIAIIGIDGTAQALEAIREGQQSATIAQNPIRMAEQAMQFIADFFAGDDVPTTFAWPTFLLTGDNIDSSEALEYGLWSEDVE
jgi:ribose transport system substrate-binding protein